MRGTLSKRLDRARRAGSSLRGKQRRKCTPTRRYSFARSIRESANRWLGEPAATRAPLYRGAFGQNRAEKHLFDTAKQRTTALVQRAHRMMDETVDRKILSEGF